MCGLVAVISKYKNGLSNDQREMFDQLLFLDTLRGEDSTGAFVVTNMGNVEIAKDAKVAWDFQATDEYKKLRSIAFSNGWAMVGHNRKATRGEIVDRNAHPFWVDDRIVLVHNGTYMEDHTKHKETEVDSEVIAHKLAENSNIEEALQEVNAAYALIWYDVENKTLHAIRNMQRPLWMMETHGSWVIASEDAFLHYARSKFRYYNLVQEPKELKEYVLHSFTLDKERSTTLETKTLDCSFWNNAKKRTQTVQETGMERVARHYGCEGDFTEEEMLAFGWYGGDDWTKRRNDHACGYGPWRDGAMVETKQEPVHTPRLPAVVSAANAASVSNKEVIINTRDPVCTNKFMDAIRNTDIKHTKFGDFTKIREDLRDGQKVKVIVNDVQEADNVPKTENYLMIGKLINQPNIYMTFPIKEKQFQNLVNMTNDAVFEIEINGVNWMRTDSHDDTTRKPMEDWKGVTCIHGKNPIPIYVNNTVEKNDATH